jgi:glutaconyl-CoA/methylmalonyl-CoA decarboxylase subunit gamma
LKKSLFVTQNERTVPVRVEAVGDSRFQVWVDAGEPPLEVRVLAPSGPAVVTVGNRVVELYRATNGELIVPRARQRFVSSARSGSRERGPGHAEGTGPLRAPMPGRIVKVLVAEGDAVVPGAGLVVMEAMKMENELSATRAGVVRRVLVKAGEAVERDAVLLELA